MPYRQGDPFLGVALPLLRAALPKLGGLIGRAGAKIGPLVRKAAPIIAGGALSFAGGRFGRGGSSGRVGYRRMNVANPKALRRALRRARGFQKLARKFMYLVGPPKPKGKSIRFKAKR